MTTLHVIDPLLKNQGGHYLGQHLALWKLCQKSGYNMVSYTDADFDGNLLPRQITVKKVFHATTSRTSINHYTVTLGSANQQCFDDLDTLGLHFFATGDIVFLTSATAERVLAYGQWLRKFATDFCGKVCIYNTVSAELDDTIGRDLKRNGIAISDSSFELLDDIVSNNEVKRSMYRYLFDSIPANKAENYTVFYEEPFPNRAYLELCRNPQVNFVYLHSMYPGSETSHDKTANTTLNIGYLGSGGIGENHKGHHLLEAIIQKTNQQLIPVKFALHLASAASEPANQALEKLGQELEQQFNNTHCTLGIASCTQYCQLIERADIVLLPYGPRYRHIMSGIFDDCLWLGTPCIIPSQSKMALWLERHNIDFTGFDNWTADAVAAALSQTIDNYSYYRQQFSLARDICRNRWLTKNPFAALGILPFGD